MINYGIIGCGMMGHEHLRNIALLEGTNVSVIFEPNPAMAKSAATHEPNARLVSSLDELLQFPNLDCLVISSPNYCHVKQMLRIAEKNPLPLLVEKPLFTSAEDQQAVLMFSKAYPALVWVAMEYRFMPPIAAFSQKVDFVTGGVKMLTIREHRFPFLKKIGNWNRFNENTGGTFVEKCCHFFDLMRLIIKSEPVRIMATAGQDVNHLNERYNGQVPDILDNGYVLLDFKNGARAMLELCMFAEGAKYQEEIYAVGPKGKLETKVPGPGRFWPNELGTPPVPLLIESPRFSKKQKISEVEIDPILLDAGDHNGATFYQHKNFLNMVKGQKSTPDVSLGDGYTAVIMGMAAQESAATGRAVHFDD